MKNLLFVFFLISIISCTDAKVGVEIGDKAPSFSLLNIDGNMVDLKDFADEKGIVLIFSCNHCPYVKLYEDRMQALHLRSSAKGFPVVAINPNDEEHYPEDSYAEMQVRAKEKGFSFAYLRDEKQDVTEAYGATKTPHVYLLKNEGKHFSVQYIGAIDDDVQDSKEDKVHYVENAIASILAGKAPEPATTKAIGCSIKWK